MNIGKIICLLLIIPLCCGCNEHETSSAPSFRQCFIEVYYSGGLELPMLQTGYFGTQPTVPPQNLQTGFVITPNYSHNNMCDSFSDPEEFLRLATRNDDTSFNQWVPDHLCLRTPAFANNFRELHVVSNADWDEEHPAGKPLDDLFRVSVRSWKQRDEYGAPLLCRERMDRIGPEHLQMIPFNPKNPWDGRKNLRPIEIEPLAEPASEQHHRLTLTMTTTDGRTKSTSIDYPPKTGL